MKLEFNSKLSKENEGITKLIKLLSRKGRVHFDFKKGNVVIEDFSSENIDTILTIVREDFEPTFLSLNNEKKFKVMNSEKELNEKKKKIQEQLDKKPNSVLAQVKKYIFEEKVFTIQKLREAFPSAKFTTLRSYVSDLKEVGIIVELERGKYALR